jgi:hypothetical protein
VAGRGERVGVTMGNEFDGITVGGESVESFLTDEFTKDVLEAKKDKHYLKKKVRTKYMEQKEPNGKAISLRVNTISALLAGQVLTVKKMCEDYNIPHPQSAGAILRSVFLSEFGNLYMKRGEYRDEKSGRMALNYYIPEYIAGVKFKDIDLPLKLAIKLSREKTDDAVGPTTPVPKDKVGERLPTSDTVRDLAVAHIDWYLFSIRSLMIDQFIHGYKHGKEDNA